MDKKHLEIWKKLRDNYSYYAEHSLKIRTKSGKIEPLVLNDAQKVLHEVVERQLATTGKVRVVILKGRQQGLSTYVGGRLYHRTCLLYTSPSPRDS